MTDAVAEALSAAENLCDQGEQLDALAALRQTFALASDRVVAVEIKARVGALARRLASELLFSGALEPARSAAALLGAAYRTQFDAALAPWRWDWPKATQIAAKRAAAAQATARAPARTPIQRPMDPTRRLTVGHLIQDGARSAELYRQAEIRRQDRDAFRLIHYSAAPMAEAAARPVADDQWICVGGLDDGALFDRIAADGVDILVDHCDLMTGGRLSVLAAGPAPAIMSRGGLLTAGLARVRWRQSDAVIHPFDGVEPWDERILRLPQYQCFSAPDSSALPPPRAPGAIRFGVFCQLPKISDAALAAWAEILRALPDATVLIKRRELSWPAAARELTARLVAAGAPLARVRMVGDSPAADHLAAYAAVDVCLDPFPFGGHTTTCEAIAVGTPVVALLGDDLVGRMGPSYLIAAGFDAWVARTPADYVRLALALAAAPPTRSEVVAAVAASSLCDEVGWTRALEAGYRTLAAAHNDWLAAART